MEKAPKLRKLPVSTKSSIERIDDGYDNRPSFEISEKMLPEIKNWKVGEKYMLVVEVEQKSLSIKDHGPEKGKLCGYFKITKIGTKD